MDNKTDIKSSEYIREKGDEPYYLSLVRDPLDLVTNV